MPRKKSDQNPFVTNTLTPGSTTHGNGRYQRVAIEKAKKEDDYIDPSTVKDMTLDEVCETISYIFSHGPNGHGRFGAALEQLKTTCMYALITRLGIDNFLSTWEDAIDEGVRRREAKSAQTKEVVA